MVGGGVVGLVGGGRGGLLLVGAVSRSEAAVSRSPGGLGSFLRSTQHRMDVEGQDMASLTSSHKSEARACRHFPGHSLTSAVLVIVPNNPAKIEVTMRRVS